MTRQPSPLATVLLLGLAVCLCLWVAVANHGPLVYHDTSAYLSRGAKLLSFVGLGGETGGSGAVEGAGGISDSNGIDGSRSPVYALFLGLLARLRMLELAVLINAAVAVGTIHLAARVIHRAHGLAVSPAVLTLAATAAACLGSLAFYTAFLMPDIFASVLIVLAALLTGYAGEMLRREILLATALGALAVLMHLSHGPIAGLIAVLALILAPIFGRRRRFLAPVLIGIMLLVGQAEKLAFRTAVSTVTASEVVLLPFITARLIQDRVGYDYLGARCPDPAIPTCRLWTALQRSDDPWRLTATHIIFESDERLGSFRLLSGEDQRAVANDQVGFFFAVLKDYPLRTVLAIVGNTLVQAGMNGIDMTVPLDHVQASAAEHGGLAFTRFEDGPVVSDRGWIAPLTIAQQALYALSALVLVAAILLPGLPRPARGFLIMVLLGILVNAFVCGAFSQPATRYGARVAWLLPAMAVLAVPFLRRRVPRAADGDTRMTAPASPPPEPTISVVMPAYRAAHLLPRVLPPLIGLLHDGTVTEVLVVDDCSPDDTARVAEDLGATVIRTPKNGGPGVARNLAAERARGDILWFVDSDVIAWPDGAGKIRAAFAEPGVVAVFGSYDEEPDGTPWFSRYKNLMHRYYHQRARREATTFWAGCGAIERDFFLKVGGFDVETYRIPSIEDIELGYRLRAAGGRILLLPDLLGKHLKVWTIPNAVRTDIYCRALPWSRLMIGREGVTNDLNTSWGERLRALVAGLFLLSLLALPLAPATWPALVLTPVLALALNLDFARYLMRHGGPAFAAKSLIYHQFYYLYSAASFVWCLFEFHVLGQRNKTTG